MCVFSVCERESYDATPDLRDQILRVLDQDQVGASPGGRAGWRPWRHARSRRHGSSAPASGVHGGRRQIPFILVGNKVDLESSRQVRKEEALQRAKDWNCPYIETSAKNK